MQGAQQKGVLCLPAVAPSGINRVVCLGLSTSCVVSVRFHHTAVQIPFCCIRFSLSGVNFSPTRSLALLERGLRSTSPASGTIGKINAKGIALNRKVLADLALNEPKAFEAIVKEVK